MISYSKYALCFLLLYNLPIFSLESESNYFKDLQSKSSEFKFKTQQLATDAKIIKKNLWKIKSAFAKKELSIILQKIVNKQKKISLLNINTILIKKNQSTYQLN